MQFRARRFEERRHLRPSLRQASNESLSEDGNVQKVAQGVPKPKLFVLSELTLRRGSRPCNFCPPRSRSGIAKPEDLEFSDRISGFGERQLQDNVVKESGARLTSADLFA
jgi:hypothetical protein